ncbi:ferredoxin [Pseudonocardia sp. EC080610-09]|uniref:FAD-dependent oxidoreductase n=1 Tax=unclassified Pseudonocardia TaxID=2619320 RepID=UPI0006CAF741|nr:MULTISPECIES: FAD-dependent oxidoreductase [unclassified Pseudonocardia]ALE74774.1 ferredoxin [Pseudonocardia sp. EC080625-04]ALL78212.1 ferredoxin [Pseudonocardia sp. EC080610-09]ALL81124.1 ferredoxin [Pseudonocardia sp. EC080619-01]
MTHVITRSCCNDASCVEVCPVDCIHPTPDEPGYASAEMLYIDPDTCIDCAACIDVCPVSAIVPDEDLEPVDERYLRINAAWYDGREPAARTERTEPEISSPEGAGPLRVAVVGTGPAACYAAESMLRRRGLDVEITMIDRLPVPGGLIRHGVAPDHQDTKGAGTALARTWGRRKVDLHLNVEVGEHIGHDELLAHHHAVLYAVGAPGGRSLGITGEDLPGCSSATDFVAWYNGHPDAADRQFDLSGERAVVVGNGNVALDVARVLVAGEEHLAGTDTSAHALTALRDSAVREVVVLGRRGPAQAAFTTPEILALGDLPGIDVVVDPAEIELDEVTAARLEREPDPVLALKLDALRELAGREPGGAGRRIVLRFLTGPDEILGEKRVEGVRVARNTAVADGDRVAARPTGETEDLDCGLVLTSVGYRGARIPGVPFDEQRGVLPNDDGRVTDPDTGEAVTGVYTAGWIKRGPSGVIGTNRWCAEDTVNALLADWSAGRLDTPRAGGPEFSALVAERRPEAMGLAAWKAIDAHERRTGRGEGRPRVKLVDIRDMLDVAEAAATR